MAREEKTAGDKGKVRVRVIEFEMEGSNQTLRDSIRDIVGAIGRGQTQRVTQLAPPARDAGLPRNGAPNGEPSVDVEVDEDELPSESQDAAEDDGSPRRPRVLRTPQVLTDLDLSAGSMPLKDFLEKLNLASDINRYAAIAYWLKTVLKVEEVNADHMHTGYKIMKWATPADASARLRQMKGTSYGYMSKGTKAGSYKFNHVGDGHVESLMKTAGIDL